MSMKMAELALLPAVRAAPAAPRSSPRARAAGSRSPTARGAHALHPLVGRSRRRCERRGASARCSTRSRRDRVRGAGRAPSATSRSGAARFDGPAAARGAWSRTASRAGRSARVEASASPRCCASRLAERSPLRAVPRFRGRQGLRGPRGAGRVPRALRAALDAALAGAPIAARAGPQLLRRLEHARAPRAAQRLFCPGHAAGHVGARDPRLGRGHEHPRRDVPRDGRGGRSRRRRGEGERGQRAVWTPGAGRAALAARRARPRAASPIGAFRARHEALARAPRRARSPSRPGKPCAGATSSGSIRMDTRRARAEGLLDGPGRRAARRGALRGHRRQRTRWAPSARGASPTRCGSSATRRPQRLEVLPRLRDPRGAPRRRADRAHGIHRRHELRARSRRAARERAVGLTVLGKAGGGVYVALAAPARARRRACTARTSRCCRAPRSPRSSARAAEAMPSFDDYRSRRAWPTRK